MHRDTVQVTDGGNAKLVEMEDVGVEGSSDARMPNVGISAAHAISNSLMDIGGLESLRRHEKGFGVKDGSIGRDGDDIKLLVGIKTGAHFFVGEQHIVVEAQSELAEHALVSTAVTDGGGGSQSAIGANVLQIKVLVVKA